MRQKKTILTLVSAAAVCMAGIAVSANSALTYWEGTDAHGVVTTDADCPLEVRHETLTFDLPDSVSNEIFHAEAWDAYRNSYTAEYEIYNPSDMSVKAVLSFPFGSQPVYGLEGEQNRRPYDDESLYSVTLNNEPLVPEVRYTYSGWRRFNINEDLHLLKDDYMEDPFFWPGRQVTQYDLHFEVDDSEKPDGFYTEAICTLPMNPQKSRFLFEDSMTGMRSDGKEVRAVIHLDEDSMNLVMTVFGEAVEIPEWTYEATEQTPRRLEGTCTLTDQKTMTYEEYVMARRPENSPVSQTDYYNALTRQLISESENMVILPAGEFLESQLMKWYRYTIEIGPGETVTNTVTAPAYPAIDGKYENPLQKYTYLLSPASLWKKFGTLDVIVHSSEYLTESSPSSFEKTEEGYKAHFDSLPEGELTFTICADESPRHVNSPIAWVIVGYLFFLLLLCGLVLFLLIKLIKALFGRKKK